MNTYQELFDEAIGVAPPPPMDLDAVITRGRRRTRNRRAAAVAFGLALVGGVAAGITVLPPVAPVQPAAPRTDATSRRYTEALQQALSVALPNARFQDIGTGATRDVVEFAHRKRPERDLGNSTHQMAEDYYFASADVIDAEGSGTFDIGVGIDSPDTGWEAQHTCAIDDKPLDVPDYQCKPQVGPHDEIIIVVTERRGSVVTYRVSVTKPDGTAVIVTAENRLGADLAAHTPPTGKRELPPLSTKQAVDLALNPAFTAKS